MSCLLPILPVLVCVVPLPQPSAEALVPPLAPEEARAFAAQLLIVADEISRLYVRPVTRKELLCAALTGLYEQLRLPLPEELAEELENDLQPPRRSPSGLLEPTAQTEEGELQVLARVRINLGGLEVLQAGNDLRFALQAMLHCLDPYCALVSAEDLRKATMMDETRHDLGFEWNRGVGDALRITAVTLGGPAQRARLRPGDEITHVKGKEIAAWDFGELQLLLNPALRALLPRPNPLMPLTIPPVELTVRRGNAEPRRVTLDCLNYEPELVLGVRREDSGAWDYWLDADRKIAHIRLGALEHGIADELTTVLTQLKEGQLRGLVLDLRWCPGGFLVEATRVAGLFLQDGVVARTRSKNRLSQWEEQEYTAHGVADFLDVPLVVLVNGETSGGAELIAAALQDHQRAVVVGQRTLGKASIQTQEPMPLPNTGLKLTNGSFFRPSGKALHRFADSKPGDDWGVRPRPEHDWPVSAEMSRQLKEWWLQLSLRPGDDNEALPLDDPENDPQRQAAVRVLEKMLK